MKSKPFKLLAVPAFKVEQSVLVGPGQQDVVMQAPDKAGNTTSQTWRVDNGPAGTVTTTHDAEGNLLTDGRYTYTWDAGNRMTSVTLGPDTWTFQYDGQNRRIAESKNGTPVRTWVWNETQIVEERTVANGVKQRRWTGGVEFLDSSNQPASKRLLITDHLGSTRVAVDGTIGSTTASYAFSPWGKRSRISGTEDLSNGYTGHLWHESGLSLAVYRPYDPETGRWPSRDPIEEIGGHYLYCASLNNPANNSDPLGLITVKCSVMVAGEKPICPDILEISSWHPTSSTTAEITATLAVSRALENIDCKCKPIYPIRCFELQGGLHPGWYYPPNKTA